MARTGLWGALFAAALLAFAVVACDDEGATCTSREEDDCDAAYAACLEELDLTSPSYPEQSEACFDALCACFDAAGCDSPSTGCDA